jgi:hypothetical protein
MHMSEPAFKPSLLTEVEELLKSKFDKEEAGKKHRVTSTARDAPKDARLDSLVLPDDQRPKMPFTKDKYLVRENTHLVAWEREARKFLRNLTPVHGHRVSASMIYEWATGISVADVIAQPGANEGGPRIRSDLRHLNAILRFYFGKSYMTWIMGRKVPNCYRVPPGYYIRRHRPMTLTLYAEYAEGSLYP